MKDCPDASFMSDPASISLPLNYGWMGTIARFLALAASDWITQLETHYQLLYRQRSAPTQRQAWLDSFDLLQTQLTDLLTQRPEADTWTLIFEYELPREGGRRPDLIILGAGHILVFEFKQKATISAADRDQVTAYARDLAAYHSQSATHPIRAIAVPTRRHRSTLSEPVPELIPEPIPEPVPESIPELVPITASATEPIPEARSDLGNAAGPAAQVLSPSEIAAYLSQLPPYADIDADIDAQAWIQAEYAPLPSIVEAARQIFQQESLPNLRRAQSAGIPDLLDRLNQIAHQAQAQQQRHLVLVTGVPGAGKTLVGLQFVYQQQSVETTAAVFLSGNGPLVTVLQYALKSRVFVQAARNFYIAHEVRHQKAAREHLIVFDEAQRAWDGQRMEEEYGIDSAAPATVLRIAERSPYWSVLVALIGDGQQIHVGEEAGIEQWEQGLQQAQSAWQVHCAPELRSYFSTPPWTDPVFNLNLSLRSHLAQDVQTWVAELLNGNLEAASKILPRLTEAGFDPYLTRDLAQAKAYCRDRYQDQGEKRYGLMASSRARNLPAYGIQNDYLTTQRVKMGAWYCEPTDSPLSCCALESVVTEFGCQGLELDFPIVGWGNDLIWLESGSTGEWVTRSRQRKVRDPLRLRLNSYRVLLTRGRDGFVVFVPPEAKMDSTFAALRTAGLPLL